MAIYLAVPDDYAGWNPTGRRFALCGGAIGAIGLLSWMSLHGYLGRFRPVAASDQLLLSGLMWLGVAGFCLMAFAAVGSIQLSLRARGSVSVTGAGVVRTMGSRTRSLAWTNIQGLVPMPYGGVTIVANAGNANLVIPRFLDDYRACIAELKAHGVQTLPPSSLRRKDKTTWVGSWKMFCFIFFFTFATSAHESHRVRIASCIAVLGLAASLVRDEWVKADLGISRWVGSAVILGILLYGFSRIVLTW